MSGLRLVDACFQTYHARAEAAWQVVSSDSWRRRW